MSDQSNGPILKIGDLPDEMILEIVKLLELKDIGKFRQTNKFNYSLISIDDYIKKPEVPWFFMELEFDRDLSDDKNFSELIILEDEMEEGNYKNEIIINKDKIVIKFYENDTNFQKISVELDITDNLKIFSEKYNTFDSRRLYIYTNYSLTIVAFNYMESILEKSTIKTNEKIERIFAKSENNDDLYYIFTKNKLEIYGYDISFNEISSDLYTLIREVDPNLYIYKNDSDNSYLVISRIKDKYYQLMYKKDNKIPGSKTFNPTIFYIFDHNLFDQEMEKFKEYFSRNKILLDHMIKGNDNILFIKEIKSLTKYIDHNIV
jgi:hypothetical protein